MQRRERELTAPLAIFIIVAGISGLAGSSGVASTHGVTRTGDIASTSDGAASGGVTRTPGVATAGNIKEPGQRVALQDEQQTPEDDSEAGPSEGMPAGHPTVLRGDPAAGLKALPPGSGTGAMELTWSVPSKWNPEVPSSNMRRAQYQVPGPDGDGQCVVYYFGPGQGGDAGSNADRWAGQFTQPDGRPPEEVLITEQLDVRGIAVLTIEMTGTYIGGIGGMGSTGAREDYMLLGAVAEGPDANWYFKFTGPEATVRRQRKAFDKMIRSLRSGE